VVVARRSHEKKPTPLSGVGFIKIYSYLSNVIF
jgi:hypothetical protein